jgi:hypothetical protein
MIDAVAAVIGLIWGAALLVVLWRRRVSQLALVLGFYLLSLYTADRILPRVLVDGWPNFDAVHSPALRPFLIFPDLLLVVVLAVWLRSVSRLALLMSALLLASSIASLVLSFLNPSIPTYAALFWSTAPLRGIGIILIVDVAGRRLGWSETSRTVFRVLAAAAGFLAIQLMAVAGAEWIASLANTSLASVWSGFAWTRPNVPGWNNNIAASAVGLGSAVAVLMPEELGIRRLWRYALVAICAAALLVAEYRTAIIVLAVAIGARLAVSAYHRMPTALRRVRGWVLASALGALAAGLLLVLASFAVPRLGDLNPVAYAFRVVSPGSASSSPSATANPAPGTADPDSVGDQGGDTSTTSRAQITRAALMVWSRQPVIGDGLGAWEFTRPITPSFLQKAITPHNGFAWTLADLGLLGLAAFYLVPLIAVVVRRRSLPIFVALALAFVLEVSIVGVAHSRYAVAYWALLALAALPPTGAMHGEPAGSGRVAPYEAGRGAPASSS